MASRNSKLHGRRFWLGIGVSAASLAAVFFFIKPAEIVRSLQTARYGYLLLCAVGVVIFLILRSIRWRFMLGNEVPISQVFHIQNIGYMLTNILPFRIGDVARAVLIGNVPPITVSQGISTMVVERVLDMMFIITLLPFTLAEVGQLPNWMQSAARFSGLLALGLTLLMILAANNRPLATRLAGRVISRISMLDTASWIRRLDELLKGLSSLTHFRSGLILIVYSVLTWIPIVWAYYATLLAVNLEPTWAMAGFVVCAAAFSVAAPSSPGQIGVFHAGVIAALTVIGQPEANAASFAFLYHALNLLLMVLMGLLGLTQTGATFSLVVASARSFSGELQSKV
jgi:uncharacterized protein (TIRG00374 family)